MLAFHEIFIYYHYVHILIESIVDKLSWYGHNVKDFLMTVDISGFFDLLAWDILSHVEDCMDFFICRIYRSNLVAGGIFHNDHLCWIHSGTPLVEEC